jgi:hypothetical protein
MCTATTITTIWSCLRVEFGTHEMLAARTTVPTFTEHPNLIDKI